MGWLTLAVAIYGAVLSTILGYFAWRRDRRSIRFFTGYWHRHDWYGIQINVVNVGFRRIIIDHVTFVCADGSGYSNGFDVAPRFPLSLEDGEQSSFAVHADDVEPNTTAFVVTDTHRRDHGLEFTPELWEGLRGFQEFVAEADPALAANGKERPAALLRKLMENDPEPPPI